MKHDVRNSGNPLSHCFPSPASQSAAPVLAGMGEKGKVGRGALSWKQRESQGETAAERMRSWAWGQMGPSRESGPPSRPGLREQQLLRPRRADTRAGSGMGQVPGNSC